MTPILYKPKVSKIDGKNVDLELVKAGLAEVYRGKPPKGFALELYLQAEAEAKKAGRGM